MQKKILVSLLYVTLFLLIALQVLYAVDFASLSKDPSMGAFAPTIETGVYVYSGIAALLSVATVIAVLKLKASRILILISVSFAVFGEYVVDYISTINAAALSQSRISIIDYINSDLFDTKGFLIRSTLLLIAFLYLYLIPCVSSYFTKSDMQRSTEIDA